jgi:uncharacterized membrane protein YozB (DUF420 family)
MEVQSKVEDLVDNLTEYAEARWKLLTINTIDKVADISSSFIVSLVVGVVAFFALFFLSIGVAWWIGMETQNPAMGFFIVGGFYTLLTLIVYLLREKLIKNTILGALIKKLYDKQ